ncbi:universal stress protein [Arthrobacter sp. H35-D1]|uniref:universal stress protein n=1 Tax=Arthrobacter sp. H35-D1 TaxID=3046202 RepID=UPI0024B87FBA|nr:universal stress protein [Arthrobacter sp. H35-D1]MDJ0313540.1 universal stress protein [Arthrobacter sp. H35-D1]
MDASKPRENLHIVVGVDGSPESVLALKWAQKLAAPLGATIKAVSAWRPEVVFAPYSIPEWDSEGVVAKQQGQALLEAFGGNPPQGLVRESHRGQAAQVLIDAGNQAQMLIVGSRGHGGFKGMLLGSVSSACAAHAKCPVLVVHSAVDAVSAQEAAGADAEHLEVQEPTGEI